MSIRPALWILTNSRPLFANMFLLIAAFIFAAAGYAQSNTERANAAGTASVVRQYRIIDQPRPGYTEEARQNGVEGSVRLNVTLLASGAIGEITPETHLPNGLTELAMAAARRIRFTPKIINGNPVDVVVPVEYRFRLYYENNDPELGRAVEITEMPRPDIRPDEIPPYIGKTVRIKVFFGANGRASVFEFVTNLPAPFRPRFINAVTRIKFKPAQLRSGKKISTAKVIEYDF